MLSNLQPGAFLEVNEAQHPRKTYRRILSEGGHSIPWIPSSPSGILSILDSPMN